MRTVAIAVVVAAGLAGCPAAPSPQPPSSSGVSRSERLQVARLEAQREAGVAALIELSRDGAPELRRLALRGLGRIGGPRAVNALRVRLGGADTAAAAAGLGILAAAGELESIDATAIVTELARVDRAGADRVAIIEAMGRLGHAGALATLASAIGSTDPALATAAGLALARLGRAKIPLNEFTTFAVMLRANDERAPTSVRHAATLALARGHVDPTSPPPAATDPLIRTLRARLTDADPLIRATAIQGLAARRAIPVTAPVLLERLDERDWRVAVELVRALGGASGTAETRQATLEYLRRLSTEWAAGRLPPPFAHAVLEGLRQLQTRADEPKVRHFLVAIARAYADEPPASRAPPLQLASAWANCLALAALARPLSAEWTGEALGVPHTALSQLASCSAGRVPEHDVQRLMFEAIAAGAVRDPVQRLIAGTAHLNPHVAGSAAALLPLRWAAATPAQRGEISAALATAIARPEAAVAGSAIEAAESLFEAHGSGGELAPVAAAVLGRLGGSHLDVELAATLLRVVGVAKLDALAICQRLRADANSTLRQAARECVRALTDVDPGPIEPAAAATSPPLNPLDGLGEHTWRLSTSQGDIEIALAGDLAPWHVASVVSLTTARFYDGLTFHRVVPDFVVQGGDPTGTGWGGPGYILPTEASSSFDLAAAVFGPGAIGIADAGKDTGGSQWFAMHGRTPHLDGRYTWIGRVVSGQDVVDRLQIGDRIIRAEID